MTTCEVRQVNIRKRNPSNFEMISVNVAYVFLPAVSILDQDQGVKKHDSRICGPIYKNTREGTSPRLSALDSGRRVGPHH